MRGSGRTVSIRGTHQVTATHDRTRRLSLILGLRSPVSAFSPMQGHGELEVVSLVGHDRAHTVPIADVLGVGRILGRR